MTEEVLRKLHAKAQSTVRTLTERDVEALNEWVSRKNAFPLEEDRRMGEIDALKGRLSAFDELQTEGALTEEQKLADPAYKRLRDELRTKEQELRIWAAEENVLIEGLLKVRNEQILPQKRQALDRVKQYEEMLEAMLSTDEHPALSAPGDKAA